MSEFEQHTPPLLERTSFRASLTYMPLAHHREPFFIPPPRLPYPYYAAITGFNLPMGQPGRREVQLHELPLQVRHLRKPKAKSLVEIFNEM